MIGPVSRFCCHQTGRPLASDRFIRKLEVAIDRCPRPRPVGRMEQAEVIFREVVETSQRVFTTGLLYLPAFQVHFGRCLTDLNRFEEAEPQLLVAYEREMAVRGEAHKNTRKAIERLAHLYEMWDKPEQASQWRAKLPTANPGAPGPNGQKP